MPALCALHPSPSHIIPPQLLSCESFPLAAEPGVICCRVSLTAVSSLRTEVSWRIYLCSFSVSHCSSHVQQNNYILAQKMNGIRAFVLISSCLPVCSLPIQLCLKQSFPLNISKTSSSPPLIFNLFVKHYFKKNPLKLIFFSLERPPDREVHFEERKKETLRCLKFLFRSGFGACSALPRVRATFTPEVAIKDGNFK